MNIDTKLTSIVINEVATHPRRYHPDKKGILTTKLRVHTDAKALHEGTLSAQMSVIVDQDNKRILLYTLTGLFNMERREWEQYIDKDRLILPKPLLASIYAMLYSHVRGAVAMLVARKKFNPIFLPIIDFEEFFDEFAEEKDYIFDMNDIAPATSFPNTKTAFR